MNQAASTADMTGDEEVHAFVSMLNAVLGSRWRFVLQELGNGHWVSVARGPPEDIVDAWQVLL